jgi:hypothetical protein
MDKKQKEALVLAMLEKGESYRSIAQKSKGITQYNKNARESSRS